MSRIKFHNSHQKPVQKKSRDKKGEYIFFPIAGNTVTQNEAEL